MTAAAAAAVTARPWTGRLGGRGSRNSDAGPEDKRRDRGDYGFLDVCTHDFLQLNQVAPIGSARMSATPGPRGLADARQEHSTANPASLSQKNGGAAPFATQKQKYLDRDVVF
jgi:hypothetical protein